MLVKDIIERKLKAAFSPQVIEVVDESHMHAGHSGAPEGGQSHFAVKIRATAFEGKSRVAQQRAIYGALKEEMAGPIHALSLDVGG
ncbi:MAG: BolA family transcriptional regulator [Rhodobacteraceae bacterium]|nr:BolA family transcriptional regulator [Paracoccaceae bacterium]